MKKLYSFYWDRGRKGSVEGLFIADSKEVDLAIGRHVYFGEILGKHSEVFGDLEHEDLTIVTSDKKVIKILEEAVGSDISGYNPLDYIRIECYDCGEPIFEDEEWYPHKVVDGNYFCKKCPEDLDS